MEDRMNPAERAAYCRTKAINALQNACMEQDYELRKDWTKRSTQWATSALEWESIDQAERRTER